MSIGPSSAKCASRVGAAGDGSGRGPRHRSRLLAERRDEFATIIAEEAAKPIKTARSRPSGRSARSSSPPRRRTLAGEMVRLGARERRGAQRALRADRGSQHPVQLPWLNLVACCAGIAVGCPRLRRRGQTPFSGLAWPTCSSTTAATARVAHVVTGGGGTASGTLVEHDDVALIDHGSPPGWEIWARAPQEGREYFGNNFAR